MLVIKLLYLMVFLISLKQLFLFVATFVTFWSISEWDRGISNYKRSQPWTTPCYLQ
mgnify:CR=1 FL=1